MGLTGTPYSTRSATRLIWLGLLVLILIVLLFAAHRVIIDAPNVARGVVPKDPYNDRYAGFGAWFLGCLLLAYRAIRGGDVTAHRRWMIRAFATGLAVGTIRVWVGIFQGFQILSFQDSFSVAFWLAFSLHALTAEAYLTRRPTPDGVPLGSAAG